MENMDKDAFALIEAAKAQPAPGFNEIPLAEARVNFAGLRTLFWPDTRPIQMKDIAAKGRNGAIALRLYRPVEATEREVLPALLFLHGGGWVLGDLGYGDAMCAELSEQARITVISVDYRLAPEHKFPAAIEDAVDALDWVAAHAADLAIDPKRLAVGGDSAGGNLAAVLALHARDAGPPLAAQILLYPVTDLTMSHPSYVSNGEGYFLTRTMMEWFGDQYLAGDDDRRHWRVSPLHAQTLAGTPPAFVITCGFDPLRDEGTAYATRLREAGVPTTLRPYDGQIHGFISWGRVIAQADQALAEVADELRKLHI